MQTETERPEVEAEVKGEVDEQLKDEIRKSIHELQAGKPEVWIRIYPFGTENTLYKIGEDGKKFQILTEPTDRVLQKKRNATLSKKSSPYFTFHADGILQAATQEDTYSVVVKELIIRAMDGVSGTVVALGPQHSGKSYTLFGPVKQFQNRGVIPRAMETLFQIVCMKQNEVNYVIRLGVVEVRKNRIRDLLSSGVELKRLTQGGPMGVRFQEISRIEHGLGLLMLAKAAQKLNRTEPYVKSHIVVYFDIQGEILSQPKLKIFKSRITIVKIAALSTHLETQAPSSLLPMNKPNIRKGNEKTPFCFASKNGRMTEAIELRKDLFLIEQMFARSKQLNRLNKLYSKLKQLGMRVLMKRPNTKPSEYFRQCKLAYAMKDIVCGSSEVRVILNIRLEKQYLHVILEAFRFGERAKCIPHELKVPDDESDNPENLRRELSLLLHELELQEKLPADLTLPVKTSKRITQNRQRIFTAAAYLDGKLDEIQIVDKVQVRAMFETFRTMWKFASQQKQQAATAEVVPEVIVEEPEIVPEKADEPAIPNPPPTIRTGSTSKKRKTKSARQKKKDALKKRNMEETVDTNVIREDSMPVGLSNQTVDSDNQQSKDNLESEDKRGSIDAETDEKGSPDQLTNEADDNTLVSGQDESSLLNPIDESIIIVIGDGPGRANAWADFISSNEGFSKFEEIKKNLAAVKDYSTSHDENVIKVRGLLTKLIQYLEDYDKIQEEKLLKSDLLDIAGALNPTPQEKDALRDIKSLETSRDDILDKLSNIRFMIQSEKNSIERVQNELDVIFQEFCLTRFGFTYGKEELVVPYISLQEKHPSISQNIDSNDPALAQYYCDITDFANKQAKTLLRSERKQKPLWKSY